MQTSLKNKTAIVTGASRGIGRKIALKLGELGAAVVVNYVNNAQQAKAVSSEIISRGGRALPVQADMRNIDAIEALFDRAIEAFGALNILVNNAGISLYKKIEDFTEEEFDTLFAINVKGLFFACRQAAKKMANGGKIINISSSVTRMMIPTYGAYAASKGAVDQITKVLAKELGPKRIQVNAISPGPVDTELFRRGKSEEQIKVFADMSAFGRIGTPRDVANAIAFLVSEESGWITGQNIYVNGGVVS